MTVDKIETKEEIDSYFSFVDRRIDRLSSANYDDEDKPLKFLIALSLIDAIATVAYPEDAVKTRFLKALTELSSWIDSSRVSLPHLVRFLELTPDITELDSLRNKYNCIPIQYEYGELWGLTQDPVLEDVAPLWPKSPERKVALGISLIDITHASLLYMQRNMLVHEQRDGTLGWDLRGNSTEPYYLGISHNSDYGPQTQLVHPILFVINLAASVSQGARRLFIEEQRNPYANFGEGHFIIRALDYQ